MNKLLTFFALSTFLFSSSVVFAAADKDFDIFKGTPTPSYEELLKDYHCTACCPLCKKTGVGCDTCKNKYKCKC
jgi:hypothetical protein